MSEKFILTLNSHSLSSYQECEAKHLYSHLIGVNKLGETTKMDQGTLYAKYLEVHYRNRIQPRGYKQRYLANAPHWFNRISKRLGYDSKDSRSLYGAMLAYTEHYKTESWIPLAVERGFSKVLYEDSGNLFIYEGRPDLIVLSDPINRELTPWDHKTQGRKDSFYPHNNQAYGYMWNYGAVKFGYNYIVLNKVTEFRREVFTFSQSQISSWVNDTTEWYFRIKHSLDRKSFVKSLRCQGRFSICPYTLICERPTEEQKLYTIQAQYKKRKPYRSW